ncbi:glycosyltransferase [Thermoflavifilum thermophilum]|uniref:Glycosyltransferase involved in cell wall bisynthesis n=1 Tax=Thermoflavifilum thermophilum TaxID=1393122 RepID=A0A1I7N9I5_9BACT|nr:glycosyltransferase [Thermoflavifilum thermophilum]SFV31354.1 Glycosyltransferase involved in cell wall bisynthesis [Thermoflavifilum thermophilum]
MRILHISPSYYPAQEFGGPVFSVHQLNRALVDQHVQVDVITTWAGLAECNRSSAVDSYVQENDWYLVDGVRVRYLPYIGYVHFTFCRSLIPVLKACMRNYDLVHITALWNYPSWMGALMAYRYQIPYIISFRGTLYPFAMRLKSFRKKQMVYYLIGKKVLQRAAAVHFTSEDEKTKTLQWLKLHVPAVVVPNGMDVSPCEKTYARAMLHVMHIPDNRPYVLILGRLHRIKGFDLLIPAFAQLQEQIPHVLVIAGNTHTDDAEWVRQLVQQYGLRERVIFTGEVSGDAKWALYQHADMFVLPSYSENFAMSVVEAMACGCPVIVSDQVGIHSEIAARQAGIVHRLHISDLREAMLQIVSQPALRAQLSQRGRDLVKEKYEIRNVACQMKREYEKIINLHVHKRIKT